MGRYDPRGIEVLRDLRIAAISAIYVAGPVVFVGKAEGLDYRKTLFLAVALYISGSGCWGLLKAGLPPTAPGLVLVPAALLLMVDAHNTDASLLGIARTLGVTVILLVCPFAGSWLRQGRSLHQIHSLLLWGTYLAIIIQGLTWQNRRGLSAVGEGFSFVGGNAASLITLGVCLDAAGVVGKAGLGPLRAARLLIGAALLLSTGTRSLLATVVMMAILVVWQLCRPLWHGGTPNRSHLVATLVAAVLLLFGSQALSESASFAELDVERLVSRLGSLETDNESFLLRTRGRAIVLEKIGDSPFVGSGYGTTVGVPVWDGSTRVTSIPDTSLILIARFGILGSGVLLLGFASLWKQVGSMEGRLPVSYRVPILAVGLLWILEALLNNLVDDRGLPIALALLGASRVKPDLRKREPEIWTRSQKLAPAGSG